MGWLKMAFLMLWPWPLRHQRKAEIERAQTELRHEREQLQVARRTQAEIEFLKEQSGNHFAQRLAHQIAHGYKYQPPERGRGEG